ncbi:MAG TPA: hypothetical protein VE465_01925 [Streptosporangiaceae bacterium]|jgi:hypothetical protein|nr:hypothetical protein [Streptosporangiaceae bacterium]
MSDDKKQALKAARENLEHVAAQSTDETPAYQKANNAVIKAEQALPWWKR